ncbi:TolC family protein [Bdellovibrio sp. SKB1291214]|uniref:TolC family protein n=1 Tax=Bdellovibrio sp. SKB1291214 TaxID=1732569 RepID=UPI000B518F30|nr:TolC family protein [Bdellovibrio sp. SKB1291214]UYL09283.1 TolC family protein [Bdellovibrio sp. SKB1291214]
MFQFKMRNLAALAIATIMSATAVAAPAPKSITINPKTLRTRLLENNIELAVQLNNVYKAKDQVDRARRNLLPGINLGAAIDNSMSFSLASVTMLLPFLLPSKWLDLRENQHLLNAQGESYYIAQLNTYSSAYSLYSTIQGDMELRQILQFQYENYKKIEDMIKMAVDAGMREKSELLQVQAQTQLSKIQVSQMDVLILTEKAAIRDMLALPLSTDIKIEAFHIGSSQAESQPLQTTVDQSLARSPELRQLSSMLKAAEAAKWSAFWSFLTGATWGASRGPTGAFADAEGAGSASFNFGNFLILKIGNRELDAIRLQKKQIDQDQAKMVETTVGTLRESQMQLNLARQAESNLEALYEDELSKFQMGLTDLLHVLNAGNNLTAAYTNRVKAQANLDNMRVGLHRMMISDHFGLIQKCQVYKKGTGGLTGKLGRIFNPKKDNMSLDQACGPQVSEN